MADAYRSIARIQKTHGRNGEVVVVPTHGLPLLLQEGHEIVLVPPELKGPRQYVVRRCGQGKAGQLVAFEGVTTLGQASLLVGKTVLVRVADLPVDFELHDEDAMVGREVQDVRLGVIGVIDEVMRGPAQDVWVVRGVRGEVLIPVVDAIVLDWSPGSPVMVDLPSGLVEER